jgi:glutathione S-transferase
VREGRWCPLVFLDLAAASSDRAQIVANSGQRLVPILVLDGGEVIAGSARIIRWAHRNAPQAVDGMGPRAGDDR